MRSTLQRLGRPGPIVLQLTAFAVCMGAAILVYPGGAWFDASSEGYDLWRNYWCDLLDNPTQSGLPNTSGSWFATVGMLLFACTLLATWLSAPTLFEHRITLGKVVRMCGAIAALGLAGIVLIPAQPLPKLHVALVFGAAIPGFIATAAILCCTILAGPMSLRIGGSLVVASATVSLVHYFRQTALGAEWTSVTPISQKIATACLMFWMVAIAHAVRQGTIDDT